jgi:Zn-dependent membrane protease YugP
MMASTNDPTMAWIGVGMVAMSAIFALVTLPVEYNASDRALAWLQSSGTLQGDEVDGARESLSWAARTYVVAALSAIATLLYYVLIIMSSRRE